MAFWAPIIATALTVVHLVDDNDQSNTLVSRGNYLKEYRQTGLQLEAELMRLIAHRVVLEADLLKFQADIQFLSTLKVGTHLIVIFALKLISCLSDCG